MSNRANDHRRIVFGIRRAVRKIEYDILYAQSFDPPPTFIKPLKEDRRMLLKVLLAYQLATFSRD